MITTPVDKQWKYRGYEVTLEFETYRGHTTSSCFINKDGNSASLEFLLACGTFSDDESVEVPQHIIDTIEEWANKHGY